MASNLAGSGSKVAALALLLAAITGCNDDGPNYRSCADASAANAAPLREGDPGYSSKLDRDGDGIACDTP